MRYRATITLAAALAATWTVPAYPAERALRVCSDPNNLPYSNDRGEGFEDKIAALIADDLHATLRMTWGLQRLGFLRRTLQAHRCDVVMGIAAGYPMLATTRPYYRSAYVFVTRRERNLRLASFDEPVLRGLKIGLHAIGAGGANPPPAESIAKRGLGAQVVGYSMYGDEGAESPAGRIIDAVAQGEIDVAAVWGPFGGYFAKSYGARLAISPIADDPELPTLPFAYDIAIGVRQADAALRDELDAAVAGRRADIGGILKSFGIPLIEASTGVGQ